jgi:hypothetical protein
LFKSLRVPEKLFALAMWVVSVVFAGFLTALGGKIVGELPGVDQTVTIDSYIPAAASASIRSKQVELNNRRIVLQQDEETVAARLNTSQNAYRAARENFDSWIATRTATTDASQDPEVLSRQRNIESLKNAESEVQGELDQLRSAMVANSQSTDSLMTVRLQLEEAAQDSYQRALFVNELTVFGLRLLITFPLLVIGGWLALKQRKSDYWPLARGFVLFALYVFFFELAPYLPSYGGYVRYGVGVIGTFVAGIFVIRAMRRYLARRQLAEQQSATERQRTLGYEEAVRKMSAGMCPGCERAIAGGMQSPSNFCVHCGLHLFDTCPACNTRKNAFYQYCPTCGITTEAKVNASGSPAMAGA